MAKICALSDLHGHLPKIEPCELVLLAGDIVPLNIQFDNAASTLWFLDEFTKWIDSLSPVMKLLWLQVITINL